MQEYKNEPINGDGLFADSRTVFMNLETLLCSQQRTATSTSLWFESKTEKTHFS